MENREEFIDKIVALEWDFFGKVNNIGGRASCQEDPRTFRIMRSSQFSAWSDELLESWYSDLTMAYIEGRNPLAEKYGYMMCITDPQANEELSHQLPPVSEEKSALCRKITERLLPQNADFAKKYPILAGHARPLRTSDESAQTMTSMETYQLGELMTYSQQTLELLDARIAQLESEGVSYAESIIENSLIQRGFTSIVEAERFLSERVRRG